MEPETDVSPPPSSAPPQTSTAPELPYGSMGDSLASLTPVTNGPLVRPRRAYVAVAVLCYINLLNYMERYTIAGILSNIQTVFNVRDSTVGLLQTVFICSFLVFAPLFGYLGDRYNRKYIMVAGFVTWLLMAAASSLVGVSQFWLLVLLRALVGVGEASYSTVAPTIIADLFTGGARSVVICIFYIFIPVGSGLGYITGAGSAALTGDWRWALRITPILGLVGLPLLVVLCPNPPRGAAENQGEGVSGRSSYLEDIKYLLKTRSYVWSSLGITALAFLTGALAFWLPSFLSRAQVTQGLRPPCTKEPCDSTDSFIFGGITVATGIMGGAIGTSLSRYFRDRKPNADPIICAVGMIGSVPCLFVTIFTASTSIPAAYVFIFFGELLLSLNWAVLADMLLYVVVPTRRSTAEALQITVGHLLGDAGSPYLLGVVSDSIQASDPHSTEWSFHSLKYSLLLCPIMGVIGGVFFIFATFYVEGDRNAVQLHLQGAAVKSMDLNKMDTESNTHQNT